MFVLLVHQALLYLPPLLRFAFKKSGFNETIEPIFVKLIKAVLDLAVLRLPVSRALARLQQDELILLENRRVTIPDEGLLAAYSGES